MVGFGNGFSSDGIVLAGGWMTTPGFTPGFGKIGLGLVVFGLGLVVFGLVGLVEFGFGKFGLVEFGFVGVGRPD